ncbi:MAG TPA: hypothetical protein VGR28_04715 [Candidatus Thermoplasmatota archaeon]|nr:hypothetical protein [Candidatus Thermoplasmatota archaeon]
MRLPIVALALAVAFAGCTAEPATPPSPEPSQPLTPTSPAPEPAPAPPAGPLVLVFNGTVGGGGAPGGPKLALAPLGTNNFAFDLANGSTGLVLELAWSTTDALELIAYIPQEYCGNATDPAGLTATCDNPDSVEGASPLKIVVQDSQYLAYVGSWTGVAFASGATPGTAFTMYASVFSGAPPADSYSAIVGA